MLGACATHGIDGGGHLMAREPANSLIHLPGCVLVLFTGAVIFHFGAVVLCAMATGSGPWVTADGPDLATPPQFAFTLFRSLGSPYLKVVKLHYNYRFASNQTRLE